MIKRLEKRFPDFKYWLAAFLATISVVIPVATAAKNRLGGLKNR